MATSRTIAASGRKSATRLQAEEEARRVIDEVQASAEARAAARAKARAAAIESEAMLAAATKALVESRTAEEARVEANGKDEWFYLQNGARFGPVSLTILRERVSDPSTDPPVKLVWTEGMDGWKPVFEVRKVCEPTVASDVQAKPDPAQAHAHAATVFQTVADVMAETETIAAEEEKIAAAEKVQAEEMAAIKAAEQDKLRVIAEAKAAEEAKTAAALQAQAEQRARAIAQAKAQAEQEAKAKAEHEARLLAAAEAKAAEETRLRMAAEAKAAEEARAAAAAMAQAEHEARTKAETEARLRAAAEAKAAEEARLRMAAEAKAAKEAKLRAAAEAKAAAEVKLNAAQLARAKAAEEAKRKALAEAKAARAKAEQARLAEEKAKAATAKPSRKTSILAGAGKRVWFYTCEGERLGPVTFDDLRAMAADSSLDPRLDMVWKQGSDDWKPAGRIDGLFERQNLPVETPEASAPSAGSWVLSHGQSKPVPRKDGPWSGTHRLGLFLGVVVFPFAWQFALAAAGPVLTQRFDPLMMGKILSAAAFVPLVVLVCLGLGRLANLGMSRWWSLAVFAPLLNLWLGYRCFACPPGYGQHKKMDGAGIAMAILYGIALLTALSLLAAAIAPGMGMSGSGNLRETLHAAIRLASGWLR